MGKINGFILCTENIIKHTYTYIILNMCVLISERDQNYLLLYTTIEMKF